MEITECLRFQIGTINGKQDGEIIYVCYLK